MFQTNFFFNNNLVNSDDHLYFNDDDLFSLYFVDCFGKNNTINPNRTTNFKNDEKNKLLGRKRKNSELKGKHTKYNLDNRVRKVKVLFKNALLEFLNSKMENIQLIVDINGKAFIADKLLNIRPKLIKDITINGNKILIDTPIKNILSEDISGLYKKYPLDYNKIVIEKIFENENNKILIDILNMKFKECLKYYRKDQEIINDDKYACLKGLEEKYENLPRLLQKV